MADTKNTKAPALDFASLTVEDADRPKVTRNRKTQDNPFLPLLAETYENKTGKAVTVPSANAGQVKYLIRAAADELGIGSSLRADEDTPKKGQTRITFAGKDRKARKSTDAAPVAGA